jgi:phosphoenolpyruvate carboxykinase (ATP)
LQDKTLVMTYLNIHSHVHYQLSTDQLRQHAMTRSLSELSDAGALVISTGKFTGRSPADKFIVEEKSIEEFIDWNVFNQAISTTHYFRLLEAMTEYLDKKPEVWIRDVYASADQNYQLSLRIINEDPQSNHFAANMFTDLLNSHNRSEKWHVLHVPGFEACPKIHGTKSANFTVISFEQRTILIGGSAYTGEIKKAVFTVLNFILPLAHNILTMHCSASVGKDGVALFFGLSGTGKTTLSFDPLRRLIGDDEHGWDDKGIFNLEGGCYAKVHQLSEEREPGIYTAIKDGAILENTVFFPGTNTVDYSDITITENTRVSYPLHHIEGYMQPAMGAAPSNIFFLTCDAYGILPPISKLTDEQALAYYLAGYTAKVAGTENGVKEPKAVFSPCFGAPFLPLHPSVYANLLKEKLKKLKPAVWMINTGWTGGGYGIGKRIDLVHTRALVNAALAGELEHADFQIIDILGLSIPVSIAGVPSALMNPRNSWYDQNAYDTAARDFVVAMIDASRSIV